MASYDKNFDVDDIEGLFLSQMIRISKFKNLEKGQKSESLGLKQLGTMNVVPF